MTSNWNALLLEETAARLSSIWIPVGLPGFSGPEKARWNALLSDRFGAEIRKPLHDCGVFERLLQTSDQTIDYGLGCALGCVHAVPHGYVKSFKAALGEGRQIGKNGKPRWSGNRERTHLT